MTLKKIISELADSDVEISIVGGDLKISGDPKMLTHERISLIKRYKLQIMDLLRTEAARNVETASDEKKPYRQYQYPDGQLLSLSRDEFYRVVDVVRVLLKMANEHSNQILKGAKSN
jgi:hypothetical protein